MNRLTDSPLHDFEVLCQAVRIRPRSFAAAVYPPGCSPASGPVNFAAIDGGAIELAVTPARYDGASPKLRELFERGSLRFADAGELHAFATSDLLAAFMTDESDTEPHPSVNAEELAKLLEREISGESDVLRRVATAVSAALARTQPRGPLILLLAGSPGCGKARAVRAVASALDALARRPHPLFEVSGRQLATESQAVTILGVPGWNGEPALARALRPSYPLILLRDIEEANTGLLARLVDDLSTTGLRLPDGSTAQNPRALIALTTSEQDDDLESELVDVIETDWRRREALWRAHLADVLLPASLLDRLAVMPFTTSPDRLGQALAERALRELGFEYGLTVAEIDKAVSDTVADIALASGGPTQASVGEAARGLLAPVFAAASGAHAGPVAVKAGPPPAIEPLAERRERDESMADGS